MAESPSAEPVTGGPSVAPRLSEDSRLQLRLHHLFALTAVMAVLLTIGGPQQRMRSFWLVFGVLYQVLAAVAVTATAYGCVWYRRRFRFFDRPGHWLMVEITIATVLGIAPTLAFRFVDFSHGMVAAELPLKISVIVALYYVLFLVLGQMVINIYLGLTKITDRRWRLVFYAKAAASILFGVADLVVIALTLRAAQIDRREQLPHDRTHYCGLIVQLLISAMIFLNVAVGMLNMLIIMRG